MGNSAIAMNIKIRRKSIINSRGELVNIVMPSVNAALISLLGVEALCIWLLKLLA